MTEPQHSQHEQYELEQDRWALAHIAAIIALAILGLVSGFT